MKNITVFLVSRIEGNECETSIIPAGNPATFLEVEHILSASLKKVREMMEVDPLMKNLEFNLRFEPGYEEREDAIKELVRLRRCAEEKLTAKKNKRARVKNEDRKGRS